MALAGELVNVINLRKYFGIIKVNTRNTFKGASNFNENL
jgi:hypothetical protein